MQEADALQRNEQALQDALMEANRIKDENVRLITLECVHGFYTAVRELISQRRYADKPGNN